MDDGVGAAARCFIDGRLDEATALCRRLLAQRPDDGVGWQIAGLAAGRRNDSLSAAKLLSRAYCCRPDIGPEMVALAHVHAGADLLRRSAPDRAAPYFLEALRLKPGTFDALNNLGVAYARQGRLSAAVECYRRALAAAADSLQTRFNLGKALHLLGEFDAAAESHKQTLCLQPDYADAINNLGLTYYERGRSKPASMLYERALRINPQHPGAHLNRSMLRLLWGDYQRGWREYEWRWRAPGVRPHGFDLPLWDGGELGGKTILLHCEQGFGDSIQFARFVRLVKMKGGRVVLSCPAPLIRLFQSLDGVDVLMAEGGVPVVADCHAPLMSLPWLLGITLEQVPAAAPYLRPPADLAARWSARINAVGRAAAGERRLKVGLLWAGNPRPGQPDATAVDRRRSLRCEQLAPFAAVPDTVFFSLQKEARGGQPGLEIVDFMCDVEDFADTAAIISVLDLVIGVDTSVIHLAGALGKPVWVMSRFDGCWRWLEDRCDSPWYPSLRLFRQSRPGDWETAISAAAAELTETVRRMRDGAR